MEISMVYQLFDIQDHSCTLLKFQNFIKFELISKINTLGTDLKLIGCIIAENIQDIFYVFHVLKTSAND